MASAAKRNDPANKQRVATLIKNGISREQAEKIVYEATVAPAANLAQRKLNKDENDSKLKVTKKIMEQEQRMAMYSQHWIVTGKHHF